MRGTSTDLTKVTAIATDQSWFPVNSSNTDQGEYRLISYQYTPTLGVAPGTATLTVEGRAKNSNQLSNSNARLQVQIPVDPSPPLTTGVPGVWLSSGSPGSNTIQGDVLLGDCTTSPSTVSVTGTDPTTNQPYTAKYTNLQFPDLPSNPSPANTLNNPSGNITLPRAGDTAITKTIAGQSVSVYEYRVNEIAFNSGSNNLTITPGQRVTFYLDGSINVGANSDIIHKCTDASNQAIRGLSTNGFPNFWLCPSNSNASYPTQNLFIWK